MAKKMYTQDFVRKAILKHGGEYDYTDTIYFGNDKPVAIRCRVHGVFTQRANDHLSKGAGCSDCAGVKRMTIEKFVIRADTVHEQAYIYDKVIYKNTDTKVLINCRNGHEFWQTPHDHLQGSGCPHCAGLAPITYEQFLIKSEKVHGDKYDYRFVKYLTYTKHKVEIFCKYHNKSFWQTPQSHCEGHGCPICGGVEFMPTEEVVQRFKIIHGDTYDYSKVEYLGKSIPILLTCREHGEFWQKPMHHWNGAGCPDCSNFGFDANKRATLYVININDAFCGFGITTEFKIRMSEHKTNFKKHGMPHTVTAIFDCSGKEALRVETLLKKTFQIVNTGIAGFKTEATGIENLPIVVEFIKQNLER